MRRKYGGSPCLFGVPAAIRESSSRSFMCNGLQHVADGRGSNYRLFIMFLLVPGMLFTQER